MGSNQSKQQQQQQQLDELSVEDISSYVAGLGSKYEAYGAVIKANAVDGEVLVSYLDCDDEKEGFLELMECMEITNKLHHRVLLKHWNKAKDAATTSNINPPQTPPPPTKEVLKTKFRRSEGSTSYTVATDASEITMDTALSPSARRVKLMKDSSETTEDTDLDVTSVSYDPPPPLMISTGQIETIEALELPKCPQILPPGSPELEPFKQVALQLLKELQGNMAQVNLLDVDRLEGDRSTGVSFSTCKGVNSLCTVAALPGAPPDEPLVARMHFDQPTDLELCRKFILNDKAGDYVEFVIPPQVAGAYGMMEPATYYGHIITSAEGLRIGTVCVCIQETPAKATSQQQKRDILKFLAMETERQLEQRKMLLQRNHNLRDDIEHLKRKQELRSQQQQQQPQQPGGDDAILAPAYGPIQPVLASQVESRDTLFPYPSSGRQTSHNISNGHPTRPQFHRRSATLPCFLPEKQANEEERSHLSSNYYQHLAPGMDKTPVGKRDMEQVALVNSLGLLNMSPLSEESKGIWSLVQMAGTLLGADVMFISFADQQHVYFLFPAYLNTACQKLNAFIGERCNTVLQRCGPDNNNAPFLMQADRCNSLCNYTLMTPAPHHQTFVVHDVTKDESSYPFKEFGDVGFYSGSPIVIRGLPLGALCCVNTHARPEFSKTQEIQQEEFAKLIAHQYETWSLRREMSGLERERSSLLLSSNNNNDKTSATTTDNKQEVVIAPEDLDQVNPPEDYAALVVTSVQGCTTMWEANPDAMKEALAVYDEVIRLTVRQNSGHEVPQVDPRGQHQQDLSTFCLAFSDVVDAVCFCLQTQEALQEAPWQRDILSLPEACEDVYHGFRGLRVGMALHCGDVDFHRDQRTGSVSYSGATFNTAMNLSNICHGGQIIVTSDAWKVASHVTDSTLGSPQVIDLGAHVVKTKSDHLYDGLTTMNLLQLVPRSLSCNYHHQYRQLLGAPPEGSVEGRSFAPIQTKRCTRPSFYDAPHGNGNAVSLLFVDTKEAESSLVGVAEAGLLLAGLSKRIATLLQQQNGGYQCSDFLLAFGEVSDAVRFGLTLQESLGNQTILNHSLEGRVKIGVYEGFFETMGPHPTTGRAEYFGSIVGQVAAVAQAAAPGCVYLGKEPDELDGFNLQPISNGYMLDFMGRVATAATATREFLEFSIYKCHGCSSWYDQVLKNRSPWHVGY